VATRSWTVPARSCVLVDTRVSAVGYKIEAWRAKRRDELGGWDVASDPEALNQATADDYDLKAGPEPDLGYLMQSIAFTSLLNVIRGAGSARDRSG
jgi:hypothetical protein